MWNSQDKRLGEKNDAKTFIHQRTLRVPLLENRPFTATLIACIAVVDDEATAAARALYKSPTSSNGTFRSEDVVHMLSSLSG